jgi:hypothetical protein
LLLLFFSYIFYHWGRWLRECDSRHFGRLPKPAM